MSEDSLLISVKKSLTDIALEKLRETGKGFYNLTALYEGDRFWMEAEAGYQVADWMKISSTLRYDPLDGKFIAALRFGGEIKL